MLSKREFCYVGTRLVQTGYEILHRIEINGITIELQQSKVFGDLTGPFFGFYIMVWINKEEGYRECKCIDIIYHERGEAWKAYKKAIGEILLPF